MPIKCNTECNKRPFVFLFFYKVLLYITVIKIRLIFEWYKFGRKKKRRKQKNVERKNIENVINAVSFHLFINTAWIICSSIHIFHLYMKSLCWSYIHSTFENFSFIIFYFRRFFLLPNLHIPSYFVTLFVSQFLLFAFAYCAMVYWHLMPLFSSFLFDKFIRLKNKMKLNFFCRAQYADPSLDNSLSPKYTFYVWYHSNRIVHLFTNKMTKSSL